MRPQFVIFMLVVVLAILALLLWRWPVRLPINGQQPQTPVQSVNAPAANTNAASQSALVVLQSNASFPMNAPLVTISDASRRSNVLQQFVEKHNVPVEYFGKVIDQDSNALAGVNVKVSVNHFVMPPAPFVPEVGSKYIDLEKTSDADGRFELAGATGNGFGVEITKNGYELEPGQRSFGPIGGSYDSPVIFKMWSTNIHEHLIGGNKSFDIIPDGRSYFINLTDDMISESAEGDLKVWIQYTNQVVRDQLYDWSAGIEVINGGLLEEGVGSAMYQAPTDGYVPMFQLRGQIRGGQRGDIGERKFYLQLKNGQEYGQMSIGLYAPFNNQTPGLIRLSYSINPSGSRILR